MVTVLSLNFPIFLVISYCSVEPRRMQRPPPLQAVLFGPLFKSEKRDQPALPQLVNEKMASYMATDCISLDCNPLVWWQTHESNCHYCAMSAKCYLAVWATSAPSERVFSMTGDIVSANRSVLSPDSFLHFFVWNIRNRKCWLYI